MRLRIIVELFIAAVLGGALFLATRSLPLKLVTEPPCDVPFSVEKNGFVLAPSAEPYHVKGIRWYGVLFPGSTLVPSCDSKYRLYDTRCYVGDHDTIDIPAPTEKILCYERFYQTLSFLSRCFHLLLPFLPAACFLLLEFALAWRRGKWGARLGKLPIAETLKRLGGNKMVFAFALVAALLLTLPAPVNPVGLGLDPSWIWVENLFAFRPDGNGVSFFFASGPLGFMMYPMLPKTWLATLFINGVYSLVLGGVLLSLFSSRPDARRGFWFLLAALVIPVNAEWRWFLLVPVVLVAAATTASRFAAGAFGALAALLIVFNLLLKFTLPIVGIFCSAMAILYIAVCNRRALVPFLLPFVGIFAVGVLLSVQFVFPGPAAFVRWMEMSVEIARGYAHAMITPPTSAMIAIPVLLALGSFLVVLPFDKCAGKRFLAFLLVAPFIGFVYKYSMVRFGFDKVCLLGLAFAWSMAVLATFLQDPILCRNARLLFCVGFAAGIGGAVLNFVIFRTPFSGVSFQNLADTVRFDAASRAAQAASEAKLKEYNWIPRPWYGQIGGALMSSYPVDMMTAAAGNLRFIPFPILQGYAAYTHKLDAFASGLYAASSTNAPEYLVLGADAIEQRNAVTDTPQVWGEIRANYTLLDHNERHSLAKRCPPRAERLAPFTNLTARVGEWLTVPQAKGELWLAADWNPTAFGNFMSLAFRETQCSLALEDSRGTVFRVRVIPDTLKGAFPLFRLPYDADISILFAGAPHDVRRIKFDLNARSFYLPDVKLSFFTASTPSVP